MWVSYSAGVRSKNGLFSFPCRSHLSGRCSDPSPIVSSVPADSLAVRLRTRTTISIPRQEEISLRRLPVLSLRLLSPFRRPRGRQLQLNLSVRHHQPALSLDMMRRSLRPLIRFLVALVARKAGWKCLIIKTIPSDATCLCDKSIFLLYF